MASPHFTAKRAAQRLRKGHGQRNLMQSELRGLRVARYLRCSSDDQAEGDFSTIDVQDALTLRFIAEGGGIDAGRYADEGRTGTHLDRPDWRRLLADAHAKKFDAVCVTYMSRLGRGQTYPVAENKLREAGVLVTIVKEQFTNDLAGYSQKAIQQFMDGTYPEMVKGWTMTKLSAMFEAGYHTGGVLPIGYTSAPAERTAPGRNGKIPRVIVVDESARAVAASGFDVFLRTRSVNAVADHMGRLTGQKWSYTRAAYYLTNQTYVGIAQWNGRTREDNHEGIVDRAVFDAAQAILTELQTARANGSITRSARRPEPSASDETRYAYYLRGLIHCPHCGGRMTTQECFGRGGRRYLYYVCLPSMKYREMGQCPVKRVNAQVLHESLVEELARMAEHPWRIRTHVETAAAVMPRPQLIEGQLLSARRHLRDTEKRLDKLTGAVAEGGVSVIKALSRRIAAEEESRTALEKDVRRLEAELVQARSWRPDVDLLTEVLKQFGSIWEARTDEERSSLMPLLVDRVEMVEKQCAVVTLLPLLGDALRIPAGSGSGDSQTANTGTLISVNLQTAKSGSHKNSKKTITTGPVALTAAVTGRVSSGLPITVTLPGRSVSNPSKKGGRA